MNFLQSLGHIREAIDSGLSTTESHVDEFFSQLQNDKQNISAWEFTTSGPIMSAGKKQKQQLLRGALVGVKDNIATIDMPTSMGSSTWQRNRGGFDARVVHTLREQGAVVIGKTKCSLFAVHDTTDTKNPRYPDCEPGTSSSGSAAAVASSQVSLALGTQTLGSIIKPASYCGVFGYKPTFGDIPRTGILKTSELLDTVGFFGRRLEDVHDIYKATRVEGANYPVHEYGRQKSSRPYDRLLILSGYSVDNASQKVLDSFHQFCEDLSKELSLPIFNFERFEFEELRSSLETIYHKELSYFLPNLAKNEDFSLSLLSLIEEGMGVQEEIYQNSRVNLFQWERKIETMIGQPLFVSLSTSTSAPIKGKHDGIDANFFITSAGVPQVSIPILRDESGKLVGVSFASKKYTDESLLKLLKTLFPFDAISIPNFDE